MRNIDDFITKGNEYRGHSKVHTKVQGLLKNYNQIEIIAATEKSDFLIIV